MENKSAQFAKLAFMETSAFFCTFLHLPWITPPHIWSFKYSFLSNTLITFVGEIPWALTRPSFAPKQLIVFLGDQATKLLSFTGVDALDH